MPRSLPLFPYGRPQAGELNANFKGWRSKRPILYTGPWKAINFEKVTAHRLVAQAIRSGQLVRPTTCGQCGVSGRIDAHHADYTRPLTVTWVCRRCHSKLDREARMKPTPPSRLAIGAPRLQARAALVEQPARPTDGADEPIPHVCFLEDLARILRVSRRTLEKRRRARVFPIRELPALDSRPRWSGEDVRRYLAHQRTAPAVRSVVRHTSEDGLR